MEDTHPSEKHAKTLNQQVDRSSDNWLSHTTSAYDKRGNLVLEQYIKGKKITDAGTYTYDETNKMVEGVNGNAEHSIYAYNGLGALMENTWIVAKNGYGYHDVSATAVVDGEVVVDAKTGKRQQKIRLTPEELEAANAAAEPENDATDGALADTPTLLGNAANGNNGDAGNGNWKKACSTCWTVAKLRTSASSTPPWWTQSSLTASPRSLPLTPISTIPPPAVPPVIWRPQRPSCKKACPSLSPST